MVNVVVVVKCWHSNHLSRIRNNPQCLAVVYIISTKSFHYDLTLPYDHVMPYFLFYFYFTVGFFLFIFFPSEDCAIAFFRFFLFIGSFFLLFQKRSSVFIRIPCFISGIMCTFIRRRFNKIPTAKIFRTFQPC